MDDLKLAIFWNDIPIGENNAITYPELMTLWGKNEREVRKILHKLSLYDNGDNYVLIRSGHGKGFYKTDNPEALKAYKKECLNKGKSVFAPVKKINRILNENTAQLSFENNLRVCREKLGLKQKQVCSEMKHFDGAFDVTMLSKMENGVCLPTPYQLCLLAKIYGCAPYELVRTDLYY